MKQQLKNAAWLKVLVYYTVLETAIWVSGIVPVLSDFWFFMGVSVISSWALLSVEGRTFKNLHLVPVTKRHWIYWVGGILAGGLLLIITAILTLWMTKDGWRFNFHVSPAHVLIVFLGCFWSSIVQEFAFRGYPFQALLNKYGPWVAQWVTIVPFTLMHVHVGMKLAEIATIFLTTGLGSLLFGLAFIKTRHLALPIGLHLGWNLTQIMIPRSGGMSGETLLIVSGNLQHYNFYNIVLPYIAVILLAIFILSVLPNRYFRQ